METLQQIVDSLNFYIWSFGIPVGGETVPFLVLALLGAGLYLTLRLGLVQFRRLGHGVAVATGRYDDPNDPGDVTHFQALTTALSATVGIGNIAGVAIAIHFGGPGALFWMWVTAVLGMATKFTEVTLAQRYRHVDTTTEEGHVAGGPMYYIERGLGKKWRPLALFFATMLGLTAFLTGNGVQANTMADTLEASFQIAAWISGLVSAAVVGSVILGGIKRIGRVTSVLAPLMALVYVGAALLIIAFNLEKVLPTLGLIFTEAFSPSAGIAGTGAGAIITTMMWGVKRGLFSNEAGQGSAPIAHAAAKTDEPVSEGVVALLEPFIDTILICTMTALVIIMTGAATARVPTEISTKAGDLTWVEARDGGFRAVGSAPETAAVRDGVLTEEPVIAWHEVPVERLYVDKDQTRPFTGMIDTTRAVFIETGTGIEHATLWGNAVENGAPLTMLAFERGLAPLGSFGDEIVLLCVLLFAVSTAISWSYYGDRCANYVLGKKSVVPYRLVYLGMHFFGAVVPLTVAWDLGDVLLGFVILPNLLALVLLAPRVKRELDSYFERRAWLAPPGGAASKTRGDAGDA